MGRFLQGFGLSIAIGVAAAMALGIFPPPGKSRESMASEVSIEASKNLPSLDEHDDDIKPSPHPQGYWRQKDKEWDGHVERPIAPAQRVKVPCRLYAIDGCVVGGPCGAIRDLSSVHIYKEECEKLRRNAQ